MAQINQRQPRQQDDDPITLLMKGLSVASQVYGIKANMQQLEDAKAKNDVDTAERARVASERERIAGGNYNTNEMVELSKTHKFSPTAVEGGQQINPQGGAGPLFAYVEKSKPAAPQFEKIADVQKDGKSGTILRNSGTGEEIFYAGAPKEVKEPSNRLVSYKDGQGNTVSEIVPDKVGSKFVSPLTSSMTKLKEPNKDQFAAAGFGRRVESANDVFASLEKGGFNRASKIEGIKGMIIPTSMQNSQRQQQDQAERNFVNSVLRRESGAAISPTEFESAQLQYFPRAGDSPQVLDQKRQNRDQALITLQGEAGNAWEKVPKAMLAGRKKEQPAGEAMAAEPPKLSLDDQAAINWLKNNPDSEDAEAVRNKLKAKGFK